VFGDGSQVRDFTYVGDIVAATVRSLTADLPPAAVLDVASGRPTAVSTLIGCLNDLLGVAGAAVQQCEERRGDVPRTEGNIAITQQRLGWAATTDLREGLRRQVEWHTALRRRREPDDVALLPAVGA
jgi:nucleoside-diphosphate-sugar epimerase